MHQEMQFTEASASSGEALEESWDYAANTHLHPIPCESMQAPVSYCEPQTNSCEISTTQVYICLALNSSSVSLCHILFHKKQIFWYLQDVHFTKYDDYALQASEAVHCPVSELILFSSLLYQMMCFWWGIVFHEVKHDGIMDTA